MPYQMRMLVLAMKATYKHGLANPSGWQKVDAYQSVQQGIRSTSRSEGAMLDRAANGHTARNCSAYGATGSRTRK
jgi:hypothetical protein